MKKSVSSYQLSSGTLVVLLRRPASFRFLLSRFRVREAAVPVRPNRRTLPSSIPLRWTNDWTADDLQRDAGLQVLSDSKPSKDPPIQRTLATRCPPERNDVFEKNRERQAVPVYASNPNCGKGVGPRLGARFFAALQHFSILQILNLTLRFPLPAPRHPSA